MSLKRRMSQALTCFQVSQSKLVPTSHLLSDCKQWVDLSPFTSLSKQSVLTFTGAQQKHFQMRLYGFKHAKIYSDSVFYNFPENEHTKRKHG